MMCKVAFSKIKFGSSLATGLLLAFATIFFSGCMKDDSNLDELAKQQEEAYYRQLGIDTVIIRDYLAANNITNFKRVSPGMLYVEETVGTGVQAQSGNFVKTIYSLYKLDGTLLQTGPYNFQLGLASAGIAGYQLGVSLLKVGGKSRFYIPSGLAYGATGSPPDIDPNTVLVFDIELLEAK